MKQKINNQSINTQLKVHVEKESFTGMNFLHILPDRATIVTTSSKGLIYKISSYKCTNVQTIFFPLRNDFLFYWNEEFYAELVRVQILFNKYNLIINNQ